MSSVREVTVLDWDGRFSSSLRTTKIRVLRRPDKRALKESENLFVACLATQLPEIGSLAHAFMHRLRALLVYQDVATSFLVPLMRRAGIRSSPSVLFHTNWNIAIRVLRAWELGAENHLIANASATDDTLFVLSCSLKELEISFNALAALRALPPEEKGRFQIADDGSYLHWPSSDIHLDLDAIRYATDPQWRKSVDCDRAIRDARFGAAVASVRKEHGLNQSDIRGVSERQIRRIEQGSRPRVQTLEIMAEGHGLSLEAYLEEVAARMSD